ncbi:hypothetical protein BT67DRAFT_253702 [Trichocladium antarcticum]|uniref:Uncharacterized protein n=1 Tax=Trichocladium antarcticum TaxID=1450529 RepID=A0AAN6ZDY7_9PEZI|nr:hypothetical protein BT67DRAFT_253702 [Trichocladium antarcticum]
MVREIDCLWLLEDDCAKIHVVAMVMRVTLRDAGNRWDCNPSDDEHAHLPVGVVPASWLPGQAGGRLGQLYRSNTCRTWGSSSSCAYPRGTAACMPACLLAVVLVQPHPSSPSLLITGTDVQITSSMLPVLCPESWGWGMIDVPKMPSHNYPAAQPSMPPSREPCMHWKAGEV